MTAAHSMSRLARPALVARLCGLSVPAIAAASATPLLTGDITAERNPSVRIRDGLILRAAVYRPHVPGKFPAPLERTPCNRVSGPGFPQEFDFRTACSGCPSSCRIQGRYASGGDRYPIKYDNAVFHDRDPRSALVLSVLQVQSTPTATTGATR